MNEAPGALRALALAAADLAAGGVLARHVSLAVGALLVAFGVLVLCTVTYRTVRRGGRSDPVRRQPA